MSVNFKQASKLKTKITTLLASRENGIGISHDDDGDDENANDDETANSDEKANDDEDAKSECQDNINPRTVCLVCLAKGQAEEAIRGHLFLALHLHA